MPAVLLPFLSTLLLYLASPGPGLAFLAWGALIPLLIFCRRATPAKAALWGLLSGTLYHLLLIYWVTISMETYGGLNPLVSWPALLLLAFYMALYFSFFCFIISKAKKSRALLWLCPLLWVSLDYIRGLFLTGFPWMDLGYSQYKYPLFIQSAELLGHHGITFLIVLTNALAVQCIVSRQGLRPQAKRVGVAAALVLISLGYSTIRFYQVEDDLPSQQTLNIAVVQANIDQALKWQKGYKNTSVERYLKLTDQARTDNNAELVIWPETALAFYPSHDPLMAHVETQTVRKAPFHLLTGAPYVVRGDKGYDYYNSAMLLSPQGKADIYFKQHLVPFGEYIPMRSILPIPKPIVESMGDFSAGTSGRPLDMGTAKIGALICIEAIYPELARRETALGATLLANITNDAWFGDSSAPVQHLAMAIFRTIENRRSMARAANTGISAFILPTGEVLAQTALFEQDYLSASLPLLSGTTFFTRAGFTFPLLCLATTLFFLAFPLKKKGGQVK